jgi:hypothetical protein
LYFARPYPSQKICYLSFVISHKRLVKISLLILVGMFISCHKEWVEPAVYTVNLSLYYTPDSVDNNLVYYFSDGMKVQIKYDVTADGSTFRDQVWQNQKNDHWEDMGTVQISGKVINLSTDTSLHIESYPLIMRVYRNEKILYEEARVENKYSY